MKRQRKYVVGL